MAIPDIGQIAARKFRTEEVAGGRGNGRRADRAVAGCPAHARRYLAIRPAALGSPYPDMRRAPHWSARAYPHLSAPR